MKNVTGILGAVLAATSVAAYAAEDADGSAAFRSGWYVAPMASYMFAGKDRCGVDNGPGAAVLLGHRGDFASIEVWGQFMSLKVDCNYRVQGPSTPDPNDDETVPVRETSNLKLNGGGIEVAIGPFFEGEILSRFFGLVGFGVLAEKNIPQPRRDSSAIIGDAGVGYLHPFRLFDRDLSVRAEARYRYDYPQPPQPEEATSTFSDWILNVGVQIPLSAQPQPEPEPAAAAVAVVPAAFGDADNDGVIDDRDQCPDTPAGSYVDNVGCPQAVKPAPELAAPRPEPVFLEDAKVGDTIVLKGVNFETARATLTANARTLLDAVADALNKRAGLRVEIGGHTDDRGSEAYNQDLSQRRADSVLSYLVERGVGAERLSAVGYGESAPTDTNNTGEGRERNRRVELKVLE